MNDEGGFTLMEIVLVLLLVGIVATIACLGFVHIANGYLFASENTTTAAKARLAMQRLGKEIMAIDSIASGSASELIFTARHNGAPSLPYTVRRGKRGDHLLLNDDILVDQVQDFNLAYYSNHDDPSPAASWKPNTKLIQITLTLTGAEGVHATFVSRLVPRNFP